MTTGNAIVLSTVLLILTWIGWKITQASRWKTVGKMLAGFAILAILIAAVFVTYDWLRLRPTKVEELHRVRLGMSLPEVIVEAGEPKERQEDKTSVYLIYENFFVSLERKTKTVEAICDPQVGHIKFLEIDMTEDRLRKKLGEPDSSKIIDGGRSRILQYKKYNLRIQAAQGAIMSFCVSKDGKGFDWIVG